MLVFEVDRPGPQAWKRQRLVDLGFGIPSFLRLVPVDFEAGDTWWERLAEAGFDPNRPAVIASTGVSMYLTKEAIAATLRQVAALAPGSTLAMSFMLPIELADPEVRPAIERAADGARASGTPFISFFMPMEMLALGREAGFRDVQHVCLKFPVVVHLPAWMPASVIQPPLFGGLPRSWIQPIDNTAKCSSRFSRVRLRSQWSSKQPLM